MMQLTITRDRDWQRSGCGLDFTRRIRIMARGRQIPGTKEILRFVGTVNDRPLFGARPGQIFVAQINGDTAYSELAIVLEQLRFHCWGSFKIVKFITQGSPLVLQEVECHERGDVLQLLGL